MAVPLSVDERRALGIIATLLVLTAGARWLERPRPLLDGVPAVDLAELEQASRDAKPAPRDRPAAGTKVDPNTATAADLATLPGVGPSLAARIVEERDRSPFRSAADLRRVTGIGPALAARLAPHVSLPAQHIEDLPPPAPTLTAAERADQDRLAAPGRAGTAASQSARSATGPAAMGPAATAQAAAGPAGPVDLNRASVAELQRLAGVGPVLAARMAARRDSLGGFRDWDAVDAVPGVGPALLARLRRDAVLHHPP